MSWFYYNHKLPTILLQLIGSMFAKIFIIKKNKGEEALKECTVEFMLHVSLHDIYYTYVAITLLSQVS